MILNRLSLKHFRNYLHKEFSFTHPVSIILGENGMGKTNMLEAISLLEKPKGLRGSDLEDLQHFETSDFWYVKNEFAHRDIHIAFEKGKKKIYSLPA